MNEGNASALSIFRCTPYMQDGAHDCGVTWSIQYGDPWPQGNDSGEPCGIEHMVAPRDGGGDPCRTPIRIHRCAGPSPAFTRAILRLTWLNVG